MDNNESNEKKPTIDKKEYGRQWRERNKNYHQNWCLTNPEYMKNYRAKIKAKKATEKE